MVEPHAEKILAAATARSRLPVASAGTQSDSVLTASAGTQSDSALTACVQPVGAQPEALPSAVLMLGIGGMGMAPLAIYLAQAGVAVFGSDDGLQPRVRVLLEAAGVVLLDGDTVAGGFADGRFSEVGLCAISSAIGSSHRLLALARSAGLHIVRRGELLARVSRARKLVAVVGSHGKTTTTGLLIAALDKLGITFDYVLGGLFQGGQRLPARHCNESQWLVAEVDESDGTIEHFAPYLTLAVNFDWDHTDRYASAAALRDTFASLFMRTAYKVIFPADDSVLPALVPPAKALPCEVSAEAIARGFNGSNEMLARAAVTLLLGVQEKPAAAGTAEQSDPHGSGSALASTAVGAVPSVVSSAAQSPSLFDQFGGIFRRQEWLYRSASLQIMTDYAHHPREVAALLDYLRSLNPEGKLIAVFQPHRYTRTRQFAREFAQVLAGRTDEFFLLPVYAASETAFAEGRTEVIADACVRRSDGGVALRVASAQYDAGCEVEAAAASALKPAALKPAASTVDASEPPVSPSVVPPLPSVASVADTSTQNVSVHLPYAIAAQCRDYLNAAAVQSVDEAGDEISADDAAGSRGKPFAGTNVPVARTTLVFIGAGDIDALARKIAADCALRDRWQQQLSPQTQVRLGEPLARRTTMRLGGSARFYADPGSAEDIGVLICLAREAGLPVWLLGRGSNLIVPDEGFDGLVISFNSDAFRQIEPQADGSWYVGSGVALKRLCAQAAREGLSGWEFLDGIPGTIGGALRMNAGAMGKCMFDVVESVDILLADGRVERRPKAAFNIGYRKCAELAEGGVALGAVIRPDVQVTVDAVRETLDNYASRRKETQPREPSAGCIFKNPQGHHAGALIDELGLKGLRVGGAEVSLVHGNFIINRGEATAADVLELVRQIRARVREQRGVELEPEALLMGRNWKDVL